METLLKSDPLLVNSRDNDGYTPLHRACYNNAIELVDLFLSYGANIAAKTEDNWEPLHSACQWNHFECASRLIQYGADVNAKSNGGIIWKSLEYLVDCFLVSYLFCKL